MKPFAFIASCVPLLFAGCEDSPSYDNSDWEISKDYKYSLVVDKTYIELGALDKQTDFSFQSNGTVTVSSDASWCRPKLTGNQIVVSLDINPEISSRKATLNLQLTDDASVNKTVEIEQGSNTVDLGLPSGTLWASFNVGAKRPEDFGQYFRFGETEEREGHDYSGRRIDYKNIFDTIFKYPEDEVIALKDEYDAAKVQWGDCWSMPSTFDFYEIVNYCSFSPETRNGILGTKVTGKNGNSIFMPLAGCYDGAIFKAENQGKLWGTYHGCDNSSAFLIYGDSVVVFRSLWPVNIEYGLSIRPVQKSAIVIFPTSATINCERPIMSVGETQILTAILKPDNTSYKGESGNIWWSYNSEVASIDRTSGLVTAKAKGSATISFEYVLNEACYTTCEIIVQ